MDVDSFTKQAIKGASKSAFAVPDSLPTLQPLEKKKKKQEDDDEMTSSRMARKRAFEEEEEEGGGGEEEEEEENEGRGKSYTATAKVERVKQQKPEDVE